MACACSTHTGANIEHKNNWASLWQFSDSSGTQADDWYTTSSTESCPIDVVAQAHVGWYADTNWLAIKTRVPVGHVRVVHVQKRIGPGKNGKFIGEKWENDWKK
ncbi:hypothetical protein BpHYR1_013095 [Brachionus plicatilis]|uniref:Uncharacterized protein n=1 Tax=Brachionus plicatilis TaxID=10195 RepID=A0A3M7P8Z6_BRAPC|nr:hypothetical protein BpHYR1_013095 [Brachionus plicatilis]